MARCKAEVARQENKDMVEVARYLWEGERKRWEISKGVVAKSSKNEIKLSFSITYISTPTSICLIVHH